MSQMPLSVTLPEQACLESFHRGPNAAVLDYLRRFPGQLEDPVVWLWGPAGTGKSHLSQALCRTGLEQRMRSSYFALGGPLVPAPAILQGWEDAALLCFDDIDKVAGDSEWEAALFALFNQCRDNGGRWLVTTSMPPSAVAMGLGDLRSRLGWGPVFELRGMEDEDRLRALQLRASWRGLELPEETGRYLLTRFSRDTHSLFRLLDELDQASLSAQRRLTIPFVRTVVTNSG